MYPRGDASPRIDMGEIVGPVAARPNEFLRTLSQVPNLAIGIKLPCVVPPSDPARRFVVDWDEL